MLPEIVQQLRPKNEKEKKNSLDPEGRTPPFQRLTCMLMEFHTADSVNVFERQLFTVGIQNEKVVFHNIDVNIVQLVSLRQSSIMVASFNFCILEPTILGGFVVEPIKNQNGLAAPS